jgi:lincosamide and streptogramin A transport system ATP-binding/permease protein
MSTITLQNLNFHHSDPYVSVFRDLSLQLDNSWRTALIGRNGRGKTTLLNLLRGKLEPTGGQLEMPLHTASFPFQPADPMATTFTVVKDSIAPFRQWERQMQSLLETPDQENLALYATLAEHYEQQRGYEIDGLIHREIAAIGLPDELLEHPFSRLSGGEQTRALIAALFLQKGKFLLLDEPTDHLDMRGRELLGEYLAAKPGFILASHDRHLLDSCTDHVLAINLSDVELLQGNYSTWKEQADRRLASEQQLDEKLKREIRKLKVAAGQRRVWSGRKEKEKIGAGDKGFVGHRAAKVMKRALAIESRIDADLAEKETLLQNRENRRDLRLTHAGRSPELLLTVDNLQVSFDDRSVISDFSMTVNRGERVALLGCNGTGKTTLFNAICGTITPRDGRISFPGYLELLRSFQQPLWQNGKLRQHLKDADLDETRFRQILAVLGAEGAVCDRPLETFSQGELKKVDLCRSFMSPAHLLLWDEPLNYVDVMSREQVEEVVLEFEPTLLFIEHDRQFVEQVATRVVEM